MTNMTAIKYIRPNTPYMLCSFTFLYIFCYLLCNLFHFIFFSFLFYLQLRIHKVTVQCIVSLFLRFILFHLEYRKSYFPTLPLFYPTWRSNLWKPATGSFYSVFFQIYPAVYHFNSIRRRSSACTSSPPNANAPASSPFALTTRKHGICSGSGFLCSALPTALAILGSPAISAIFP